MVSVANAHDLPLPLQDYLEQSTQSLTLEQKEEAYEILQDALSHPYDLNQISRKELESFPFLSALQIENLLEYRYDHSYFLHRYELALVEGWDENTLTLFSPFYVVADPTQEAPSFQHFGQHLQQECLQQISYTFQKKEGFKNHHYLGPPVGMGLKYQFSHPLLSFGLSMESDAGEPFTGKYNKGFDFYSAYFSLQKIKYLHQLILGDFKAQFGQGLVLSSSSFYGGFSLDFLHKRKDQLSAAYSFNEVDFLRGLGITLGTKNWELTVLGSIKHQDSLQGIHRTEKECLAKYKGISWGVGGNFNYRWPFLKIGFSTYYNSPTNLAFFSVDYRGVYQFLHYSGEIALNTKAKVATVHSLSARLNDAFQIGIQGHYYDAFYQHTYGKITSSSAFLLGEYGATLGIKAQWGKFSFLPSWEGYRNIRRKSTSHQPAIQYRVRADLQYTPSFQHLLQLHYQWNSKEKNKAMNNRPISPTLFYQKHQLEFSYKGQFENGLYLQAAAIGQYYFFTEKKDNYAYLIHLDIGYKTPKIKCVARLALFDIPLFANRISLYENSLPTSSSFYAYYNKGIRAYVYGSFQVASFCKIYLKLAHTFYTGQKNIGTGEDCIQGPHRTDILFLLQWNW